MLPRYPEEPPIQKLATRINQTSIHPQTDPQTDPQRASEIGEVKESGEYIRQSRAKDQFYP